MGVKLHITPNCVWALRAPKRGVLGDKKLSARSIPIYTANLATLEKVEFLSAQNAPFGRPWRPNLK